MIKDIIIKSAELLNRDDIVNELNSPTSTKNDLLQNDIIRLIHYYNYTVENLCENFFPIYFTDNIVSDASRKIYYNYFSYEPLKIISISNNGKNCYFTQTSHYLLTPNTNTKYEITYQFLPKHSTNLNENEIKIHGLNKTIICYGIVSEFLASKSLFDESKFWHDKFMFEIYKSRTNSNKKIKATFRI